MYGAGFLVTRRRGEDEEGECCGRNTLHAVRCKVGRKTAESRLDTGRDSEPNLSTLQPHTLPLLRWRPRCCGASCPRVLQEFSRGISPRPLPSASSPRSSRGPRQPARRTFSTPTPSKTCMACMPLIFWRKLVPGKRPKLGILLVRCLVQGTS